MLRYAKVTLLWFGKALEIRGLIFNLARTVSCIIGTCAFGGFNAMSTKRRESERGVHITRAYKISYLST